MSERADRHNDEIAAVLQSGDAIMRQSLMPCPPYRGLRTNSTIARPRRSSDVPIWAIADV
jgi:hypothetical protein